MAKKSKTNTFTDINYSSAAEPRETTPDGYAVYCAFDELVEIEKLIPNPQNPNQHSAEQVELLGSIIKANGWRESVTVSTRSGFIVKGHGRREAAVRKGMKYVPVQYQNYANEAEEWADLIADNRLAELSTLDNSMLVDLINEMDTGEVPLELTGYTEEDIEEILAAFDGEGDSEDDGADALPPTPNTTMSRAGDLWLLGNHRLICGSATDKATTERLMDGEKAQLVNTDPPYGVAFTGSGRDREAWDMIENDDKTGDELLGSLLLPTFKNYVAHTTDDAAFYIWYAFGTRKDFDDAISAAGLIARQQIIWVKNNFVIGRNDYQWKHEPCFYAEKAGHTAKWSGDRSETTTWSATLRDENELATTLTGGVVLTDGQGGSVYICEKPPKGKKIRYIRLKSGKSVYLYAEDKQSTVWEVAKDTKAEHPTQKPVELAIRAITNSSEPGDIVIDFFGGSGSTLMGAEMTGRRCYCTEIAPRYCDVIINRYINYTGNYGVTCIRDGKELTYAELKAEIPAIAEDEPE